MLILNAKDSAAKRHRQSQKRRLKNRMDKSKVKTQTKKYLTAISAASKDEAEKLYRELTSLIDRTAQKGVFHKNKAARQKSRLNKMLRKTQ
jgi:small subunit ribosomal protein S20